MLKYNLRKLTELALLLNFILLKAFLIRGLKSQLKSAITVFSKSLFLEDDQLHDIIIKIEDVFNKIHKHQFIMYKFELNISSNPEIYISILNKNEIDIKSMKTMLKENAKMLERLGYEATLEGIT